MARRAIRRLGLISVGLVLAAAALAAGGGWLAAFLLTRVVQVSFGAAWVTLSVLFFLGPTVAVVHAEWREGRRGAGDSATDRQEHE